MDISKELAEQIEFNMREHGGHVFGDIPNKPFTVRAMRPVVAAGKGQFVIQEVLVDRPLVLTTRGDKLSIILAPSMAQPFLDHIGDEIGGHFKVEVSEGKLVIIKQVEDPEYW